MDIRSVTYAGGVLQSIGPEWMEPAWLLDRFGQEMFWVSLLIVFVECGLFFPFLPGDILLFFIGLFIKRAEVGQAGLDINIGLAMVLLSLAAFAGNVVGYEIGRLMGPPLYQRDGKILKRKYFDQTRLFFDRYGNKALVLGRFVPVVRTYITVVAGITMMPRRRFFTWSAIGAVIWVVSLVTLGYFLGYVKFLQTNLEAALLLIVILPLLPMFFEVWRARRNPEGAAPQEPQAEQA